MLRLAGTGGNVREDEIDLRAAGPVAYHPGMLEEHSAADVVEENDGAVAKDGWDMQERRSFPRTGLALPVHLTVVPGGSANQFSGNLSGTTSDVSRGGCAVVTNVEIAARTRCIARFPISTGRIDPDTVWAEVRRSRPNGRSVTLGLEFDTPLDSLRIAPAGPATEEASGPRKILIVDDQSGIRGLLSRYLGEHGFQVQSARDGEEAFRLVMNDPPDIMLLDLYLPRLNGHDLLRRMQETGVAVDLIYTMSGYADTADAQECLRLGATDHLLKPIDLDHLRRSILLRLGAKAG